MIRFARATGYAVAAILVASSPTFANTHADPAPLSASYLSHTVSMPEQAAVVEAPAAERIAAPAESVAEVTAHVEAAVAVDAPALAEAKPLSKSLPELVSAHAELDPADREHECLAGAIYFESKGEPLEGQLAVAEVVINRSKSGRFPTTLCGVIKQPSQFSFIRGGQFPPIRRTSAEWRKAVAIAHVALEDLADSRAEKAMFFHATYVRPGWRGLKRVAQVGNHIFYR
jgi:spore germination cell wall hydrolase CwlJ-like protein